MSLALVGFGELGHQILKLRAADYQPDQIYYLDDIVFGTGNLQAFPFSAYPDEQFSKCEFLVCLGYRHLRLKVQIVDQLLALGRHLPEYVAPSAYVAASATVGNGTIVYPMCNIDSDVRIGNGVLVNNSVTISHNSVVGDGCFLSPGVTIAGFVIIGRSTFVGAGTVVANNVTIGDGAMIGIGTVVTQDVPDGVSVIGNPMKVLDKPLRLR